jgi:hypothetical protein
MLREHAERTSLEALAGKMLERFDKNETRKSWMEKV